MSTNTTQAGVAQWRVASLSMMAAGFSVLSSLVARHESPWSWTDALTGVIALNAGLQLLLAVRGEMMSGPPNRRTAWLGVAALLFVVGTGFFVVGVLAR